MKTFKQCIKEGLANMHDLNDWIDAWHDGDIQLSLQQYLGFDDEEMQWLLTDEAALWMRLFEISCSECQH